MTENEYFAIWSRLAREFWEELEVGPDGEELRAAGCSGLLPNLRPRMKEGQDNGG